MKNRKEILNGVQLSMENLSLSSSASCRRNEKKTLDQGLLLISDSLAIIIFNHDINLQKKSRAKQLPLWMSQKNASFILWGRSPGLRALKPFLMTQRPGVNALINKHTDSHWLVNCFATGRPCWSIYSIEAWLIQYIEICIIYLKVPVIQRLTSLYQT